MNISEILQKYVDNKSKKSLEKLAEQGAEKVQATFEEFKEEKGIDEVKVATEAAMEEMLKHPERKLAVEMIGNINENVSPEVAVNAVIQLTEADEFSEKTAIEVATKTDFSDEHIITIIEEGSIGYKGKTAIAETLKNEKIREEVQQQLDDEEEKQCLKKLHSIYLLCDEDINESRLKENLDKVMNNVHIHTNAIQEIKNKIIARLIAFNFARYGSNIVSKQTALMTANQMIENNIVKIVSKEYRKIVNEYKTVKGRKIREFDEKKFLDSISVEIETATKNDGFEEKNAIKNIIQSMNEVMGYDERKARLISLQEEIENSEIRKTSKKIRESGIIEKLSELPEEEIEKVLNTLGNLLDKRKDRLKVIDTSPKIKSYEFATKAKKSNEERE